MAEVTSMYLNHEAFVICALRILRFSFKTSTKILPQIHTKGGLWQALQTVVI